ncbi:ABC transporter transmembrane domain-containing protein [Rudanella paleaurantiibacter]|nr:ABC transporter transmembrane domain-containing protein [Rudanella paleaurantiibacter]
MAYSSNRRDATFESPPSPFQRLMRLLGNEKRDIWFVYLYAIIAGLISLSLPLGIQAVFNFVSSGTVFNSIYLLIGLVIVGVVLVGLLQIGQMTLVEVLQQRIFAKAAFEFTYRLPRIQPEALSPYYPPELMNRFFDIITVQKSLPKLLIDITAAAIQVVLGLILLSFYHPVFIVFGALTASMIAFVVWIYGNRGIETSLNESKYKYKVAAWLEELARDLTAYRREADSLEAIDKMDDLVSNYLKYRNEHYGVLKRFFYNAVAFKTIITGGLLVLGTALVVERQMTLGQFVAAELVIVLITGSVEKLIMSIETYFDLLTGLEKLGSVTDLPLETDTTHA